jgi:hypothetical protein
VKGQSEEMSSRNAIQSPQDSCARNLKIVNPTSTPSLQSISELPINPLHEFPESISPNNNAFVGNDSPNVIKKDRVSSPKTNSTILEQSRELSQLNDIDESKVLPEFSNTIENKAVKVANGVCLLELEGHGSSIDTVAPKTLIPNKVSRMNESETVDDPGSLKVTLCASQELKLSEKKISDKKILDQRFPVEPKKGNQEQSKSCAGILTGNVCENSEAKLGEAKSLRSPFSNNESSIGDKIFLAQSGTSQKEDLHDVRLPLVGMYGNYIHPTDTSLHDARSRLRKALDQTRILRVAFTERVYEKYKVILKPVPASVDQIVNTITADPIGAKAKVMEEIRFVKEEKEIERKDSQQLSGVDTHAPFAEGKYSSGGLGLNVETPEQLAFIGAGLNLVILPEEDIQGLGIDSDKYKFRGPINPETGHRVGGISAAAATAAEAILDRVRRSAALRAERLRKEPQTNSENLSLLNNSHNGVPFLMGSKSLMTPTSKLCSTSPNVISLEKRQISQKGSSNIFPSKSHKAFNQLTAHMKSVLSLDPHAEDLNATKRLSASTSALLSKGVGKDALERKRKHPHPSSLGARRASVSSLTCSRLVGDKGIHTDLFTRKHAPINLLSLPGLGFPIESNSLKLYDTFEISSKRALRSLESVLSHFAPKNSLEISQKLVEKTSRDSSQGNSNRRATEIGLMHGMQHSMDAEGNAENVSKSQINEGQLKMNSPERKLCQSVEQSNTESIEPMITFSVLQALGLIHDVHSPQRDKSQTSRNRMEECGSIIRSEVFQRNLSPSSKYLDLYEKASSRKRSFTEAFSKYFNLSTPSFESISDSQQEMQIDKSEAAKGTANSSENSTKQVTYNVQGKVSGDCPILSLRGGGIEEEKYKLNPDLAKTKKEGNNVQVELCRPQSAPASVHRISSRPSSSSSTTTPFTQGMIPVNTDASFPLQSNQSSSSDAIFSLMAQSRVATHASTSSAFTAQANNGFSLSSATVAHQGVVNQLQAHAHQLRLQAASMNCISPPGDLSNFFGAGMHQRQAFANHGEWPAMGNAQQGNLNIMQSHSSLTALGMNAHQAAMLEFTARDRATRAMQQATAVQAAVMRQANVMRATGPSLPGLSSQQAPVFLHAQANQVGAGIFSPLSATRFGQLSGRSAATAAAILSNHSSTGTLGNSQNSGGPVLGNASLPQNAESRPTSQHSTSSSKSLKSRNVTSAKGKKESKDQSRIESDSAALIKEIPSEATKKALSNKRNLSEITQTQQHEKNGLKTLDVVHDESPPLIEINVGNTSRPDTADISPREQNEKKQRRDDNDDSFPSLQKQAEAIILNACDQRTLVKEGIHSAQKSTGLQFFDPPIPSVLELEMANSVCEGRIHMALRKILHSSGQVGSLKAAAALLEYLQALGAAVPIPKALISNPLKERLNPQNLKSSSLGTHAPSIPRDIVAAVILVWLWVQHKDSFQRAFGKSGRIDVDPECKWLIQAATDTSSRALLLALTGTHQNGGLLSSAMTLMKTKGTAAGSKTVSPDIEKHAAASLSFDAMVACVVSEALMTEFCIDEEVDFVIPVYKEIVQLIDETRMLALRSRCMERVLLANLVARYVRMSEAFAESYVSSVVRAGEAFGHGDLFESVQDEMTSTSTMMPFDIISDESSAWEDPCRPEIGFKINQSGDVLFRCAHARAMISKSLKKFQVRNLIRGGISNSGPYSDRNQMPNDSKTSNKSVGIAKRRTPFSDQSFFSGTGSGKASSISEFNPHHLSTPLMWDEASPDNMPHGKDSNSFVVSTATMSGILNERISTKADKQIFRSIAKDQIQDEQFSTIRTSQELEWFDVAHAFVPVALSVGSNPSKKRMTKSSFPNQAQPINTSGKTIFAPFCNRIDEELVRDEGPESDGEDLSEESILKRHQVVLDKMKERLDAFMDVRNHSGQRARQRTSARTSDDD